MPARSRAKERQRNERRQVQELIKKHQRDAVENDPEYIWAFYEQGCIGIDLEHCSCAYRYHCCYCGRANDRA